MHRPNTNTIHVPIEFSLEVEIPYAEYQQRILEKIKANFEAFEPLIAAMVRQRVDFAVQELNLETYVSREVEKNISRVISEVVSPSIIMNAATAALKGATAQAVTQALESRTAKGRSKTPKKARTKALVGLTEDQAEKLKTTTDELALTSRAFNCLSAENIETLGELVRKTETELIRIPNLGRATYNEIKEVVESYGLRLGMK